MLISVITGLVQQQIFDTTGIKWNATTNLLPYYNMAIKEIVTLKPSSYPTTQNITIIAGPIQTVPATAIGVVDFVCNMGADGQTPGKAIVTLDKQQMDDILPDWMSFTANSVVSFGIVDSRNPMVFYVFPPQPANPTQKIRAILSTLPTDAVAITGTFPLDDNYQAACVDYIVHRVLAEETSIPNALNKSVIFRNQFYQSLGLMSNAEKQTEEKGQ